MSESGVESRHPLPDNIVLSQPSEVKFRKTFGEIAGTRFTGIPRALVETAISTAAGVIDLNSERTEAMMKKLDANDEHDPVIDDFAQAVSLSDLYQGFKDQGATNPLGELKKAIINRTVRSGLVKAADTLSIRKSAIDSITLTTWEAASKVIDEKEKPRDATTK